VYSGWRAAAARVRSLFGSTVPDSDLDDEIHAYLQLLTEHYVARGMRREEAERAERRQFGNRTYLQEDHREMRTYRLVETFSRDLRYRARQLRMSPSPLVRIDPVGLVRNVPLREQN